MRPRFSFHPHLRYRLLALLLVLFSADTLISSAEQPSVQDVVNRMMEQVKRNLDESEDYGSTQRVVVRKLKDGRVNEVETKTYRTLWIQGKPYSELILVNDKPLSSRLRSDEIKRKQKFIESIRKPGKSAGFVDELKTVHWWEIHNKYEFKFLPADAESEYVLAFQPKKGKLPERTRVEKILNHLRGTIWLDDGYNVIKATTSLDNPVRFMIGIAKLDEMQAYFQQQPAGSVFLPASLHVMFKAHAGFFKKEHQEITANWLDIFPRYASSGTIAPKARK